MAKHTPEWQCAICGATDTNTRSGQYPHMCTFCPLLTYDIITTPEALVITTAIDGRTQMPRVYVNNERGNTGLSAYVAKLERRGYIDERLTIDLGALRAAVESGVTVGALAALVSSGVYLWRRDLLVDRPELVDWAAAEQIAQVLA